MRTPAAAVVVSALALACSREDSPPVQAESKVCPRPSRGLVVSLDSVGDFSTRSTLDTLRRQCAAGDTALYDAVGYQTGSWVFPFAGAKVIALLGHGFDQVVRGDEVPTMWILSGDSVRLPDGALVPRTLGELKARYGYGVVSENTGGDDFDGPGARFCRIPFLHFQLETKDTARVVPDSARIGKSRWTERTSLSFDSAPIGLRRRNRSQFANEALYTVQDARERAPVATRNSRGHVGLALTPASGRSALQPVELTQGFPYLDPR